MPSPRVPADRCRSEGEQHASRRPAAFWIHQNRVSAIDEFAAALEARTHMTARENGKALRKSDESIPVRRNR